MSRSHRGSAPAFRLRFFPTSAIQVSRAAVQTVHEGPLLLSGQRRPFPTRGGRCGREPRAPA
eukprot:scaffold7369_cov497-Prasinococcus_capsulatus_cf.AAC.1